MTESAVLTTFAQNGPWAVVAGFLLWTVLQAWTKDRDTVTHLLGEFRSSIDQLAQAVTKLTERLDHIEAMSEDRHR